MNIVNSSNDDNPLTKKSKNENTAHNLSLNDRWCVEFHPFMAPHGVRDDHRDSDGDGDAGAGAAPPSCSEISMASFVLFIFILSHPPYS